MLKKDWILNDEDNYLKICKNCGEEKDPMEFYNRGEKYKASECKDCAKERTARQKKNKI